MFVSSAELMQSVVSLASQGRLRSSETLSTTPETVTSHRMFAKVVWTKYTSVPFAVTMFLLYPLFAPV